MFFRGFVQDAFSLFSQYAAAVKLSPAALARGHALLRELDLPARALRRPRADVVFRRLELEGYGPFLARTEYCLGPARGLRAITGSIQDGGQGSDSNGAGEQCAVYCLLVPLQPLHVQEQGDVSQFGDGVQRVSDAAVLFDAFAYASRCIQLLCRLCSTAVLPGHEALLTCGCICGLQARRLWSWPRFGLSQVRTPIG